MLFKNKIGAIAQPELHQLKLLVQHGVSFAEIQIEDEHVETIHQWGDVFSLTDISPVSVKMPAQLKVGDNSIEAETFGNIVDVVAEICPENERRLVLQSATTSLGEIFEYLDTHARDFTALSDFKSKWKQSIISEIKQLKAIADEKGIQLLMENSPLTEKEYFEPGNSVLYPSFRTPQDLLDLVTQTGIACCFNSANAKITTNILSYMRRSRSLFAAATEEEIEQSPKNWVQYYEKLSSHIKLIQLSDSISWGDTDTTTNIPFREESLSDLLSFAEIVADDVPIILNTDLLKQENLKQMMKQLRQLKRY